MSDGVVGVVVSGLQHGHATVLWVRFQLRHRHHGCWWAMGDGDRWDDCSGSDSCWVYDNDFSF